jgi:hypothetical protein
LEQRKADVSEALNLGADYSNSLQVDLKEAESRLLRAGFAQVMGHFWLPQDFSADQFGAVMPDLEYYAYCAGVIGDPSQFQNGRMLLEGAREFVASNVKE